VNTIKVGLLFSLGFFFLACGNFITTPGMNNSGNVQITLSVQENLRTIIPEVGKAIVEYMVTFTSDSEDVDSITLSNGQLSTDLPQGIWDVIIDGKNIDGLVVASGTETGIVVTTDNTTFVTIDLMALTEETGLIDVTVDWSAADSVIISNISAALDGVEILPENLEITETSIRYSEIKNSGNYMLFFYFDATAVGEAIQVNDNLTSSATIFLDNDDFNLFPSTPSNLTAMGISSTQIELSWSDNSHNEEGFKIERSSDGNSFYPIDIVSTGIEDYSDTELSENTEYYYRVRAYNSVGDSNYSNTDNATTSTSSAYLLIDHTSVSLFDQIPQFYIDEVKKKLLILPGESHGRAYGYGLELLEEENDQYDSSTNWYNAAETYTDQHLRWNRSFLDNTTWNSSCGEEDFWTNTSARTDTLTGLQYIDANYTGDIYFGFGWCWDTTWTNSISDGTVDSEFGCRWDGSTADGPDGNKIWGLNSADSIHTGNSISMDTYLQAVDDYNTGASGIKTIYTTGPVDNERSNESGYQRYIKHEYIRQHVQQNGGILFDYADILSWNYDGNQRTTDLWDGHFWDGADADMIVGEEAGN